MRWLRMAAPALALALWLAGSAAQQGAPPAGTPPQSTPSAGAPPARTPPAGTPQPSTPQPAATPEQEKDDPQQAADDADEQDFTPTEELQPDAAVTFPVDI